MTERVAEALPIAAVKALVEDNMRRAYERGHADGINCDANSGFGVGECEHVGPGAAAQADRSPVAAERQRMLTFVRALISEATRPTGRRLDNRWLDEVVADLTSDHSGAAAQADTYPTPHDRLSAFIEGTFLDPEERDKLRAALEALSADTERDPLLDFFGTQRYEAHTAADGHEHVTDADGSIIGWRAQADPAPGGGLRELVEFIADWAHDCSPSNAATPWDRKHGDEIDPRSYGFDDIEERCRAALAAPSRDAGLDDRMLRWVAEQPLGFGDWACVECRPGSDMLVEGFRCMVHEARHRLASLDDAADGAPFPAGVNRADSEGER